MYIGQLWKRLCFQYGSPTRLQIRLPFYSGVLGFVFVRLMARAPVSVIIEASLKIVGVSRIRVRAPAVTAPRAAPTLNMVER